MATSLAACGDRTGPEPVTGALAVSTNTTGTDADDDGYTFSVDQGPDQAVGPNQHLIVPNLSPGAHRIAFDGIAANCELESDNPRSVTVQPADTIELALEVRCSDATGTIVVSTRTTGESRDPDGYAVTLDGRSARSVATDGSVTFPEVSPGPHVLSLSGLAPNCLNTGANPVSATVVGGQTSPVKFEVQCLAAGFLRIVTITTGDGLDPDGYSLQVDREQPITIAPNGTAILQALPGEHELTVGGVAPNCSLSGGITRRLVTVEPAVTVEVKYEVECSSPGIGRLVVTVQTLSLGASDPDGYSVTLDGNRTLKIGSNDRVSFGSVPSGVHSVSLTGFAPRCGPSQSNPKTATVLADRTTTVAFTVVCLGPAGLTTSAP